LFFFMPIWLQALGILWSSWWTASCSGTCRFLVGVCCKTVTRQEWLFTICQGQPQAAIMCCWLNRSASGIFSFLPGSSIHINDAVLG
jgi:hypothetical protein